MDASTVSEAVRLFHILVSGQKAARFEAQAILERQDSSVDRARLRLLVLDALTGEYRPGREKELQNEDIADTRCWLLGILGRLAEADVEAGKLARKHLLPEYEPQLWSRYWALEGLIVGKANDIDTLAREVLQREEQPPLHQLALAVLADRGDANAREEIAEALASVSSIDDDNTEQWATVRALQIVPMLATVSSLCQIIDNRKYTDVCYEAVVALGRIPIGTSHAAVAARTLENVILSCRRYPGMDGMRTKALIGLGNLEVYSIHPTLLDELCDDNPAIVRAAARSLEKILGIHTAASRIVELASKKDPFQLSLYAAALRYMSRTAMVEELENLMTSGSSDQQEAARTLLSEIGGAEAFQKLRARTTAMSQYTKIIEDAERKIQALFEQSLQEAIIGFRWSLAMDLLVFFIGVVLICASASLVFIKGGSLQDWVGVAATGTAGVLGVVYTLFIANPRERVREAVKDLMNLKVVFLAYLRQLNQIDQAYTRRLLDDALIQQDTVAGFSDMIDKIMGKVVEELALHKSPEHSRSTDQPIPPPKQKEEQ